MSLTAILIIVIILTSAIFAAGYLTKLRWQLHRLRLEESKYTLLFHFFHIKTAIAIFIVSLFAYSFFAIFFTFAYDL